MQNSWAPTIQYILGRWDIKQPISSKNLGILLFSKRLHQTQEERLWNWIQIRQISQSIGEDCGWNDLYVIQNNRESVGETDSQTDCVREEWRQADRWTDRDKEREYTYIQNFPMVSMRPLLYSVWSQFLSPYITENICKLDRHLGLLGFVTLRTRAYVFTWSKVRT